MSSQPSKTENIDLKVTFNCPYCGAKCSAGYTVAQIPKPVVLHAIPTCQGFMKDEPFDVLLRKARKQARKGRVN